MDGSAFFSFLFFISFFFSFPERPDELVTDSRITSLILPIVTLNSVSRPLLDPTPIDVFFSLKVLYCKSTNCSLANDVKSASPLN